MTSTPGGAPEVRVTRPEDFPGIIALTRAVYPASPPWSERQLASHLAVFPEGQFVAVAPPHGTIVGMAASLIVQWDDYDLRGSWHDFTAEGMFTNHDAVLGRTLYAAEVMAHPSWQGRGIGSALYRARESLVRRLRLLRIRAGSRLRGYHRFAASMSADEYVSWVVRGDLRDPTLSFQLHRGFRVLSVVSRYLSHDPESQGYAAVIEWLNPKLARPEDYRGGDPRFAPPSRRPGSAGQPEASDG